MKRNKDNNQHIKFLTIIDIIKKHSDSSNYLTFSTIKELLYASEYDFNITPRLVRTYVEQYNQYYDDVISIHKSGRDLCFSYVNPDLDEMEAKAIIDLVYSSNFFTYSTKKNYKKRIQEMFSINYQNYFEKHLDFHVSKNENPLVFYEELDKISKAIQQHKKIQFTYKKPKLNKERYKTHELAPIDTTFSNNEYYLICQGTKNLNDCILFRLDYIRNVKIINDSNVLFTLEQINKYKEILKNITYMYSEGDLESIELTFNANVYTNIIDKFGKKIKPIKVSDDKYKIEVRHVINSTFYSWIIGFAGAIKITGNRQQVTKFKDFLNEFI